jgi:hypothetical protein
MQVLGLQLRNMAETMKDMKKALLETGYAKI